MTNKTRLPFLSLCFLLAACVTVNVYFPAAAAEQAADKFVKDVYGTEQEQEDATEEPTTGDPQSSLPVRGSWLGVTLVNIILPEAYAQAPDINIATPAINKLKASMKQRHAALEPFYSSGAVGMTADGLLKVRDAKAIALKDRNKVNKLVADENRERNTLYAEVSAANGHPEWEGDIRGIFAKRWIGNAPAGWWHQLGGSWTQK